MRIRFGLIVLAAALAASGCAQKGLRDLRKPGTGPDEFLILPAKPLDAPASFSTLPPPTPGGSNITDQNPQADAVAALGGNPAAMVPAGSAPARDSALVTAASRYGVQPAVRETLATEDAEFRSRNRVLTQLKLFPVDRYEQLYRRQSLDAQSEIERFRRAGIETPAAPPPGSD